MDFSEHTYSTVPCKEKGPRVLLQNVLGTLTGARLLSRVYSHLSYKQDSNFPGESVRPHAQPRGWDGDELNLPTLPAIWGKSESNTQRTGMRGSERERISNLLVCELLARVTWGTATVLLSPRSQGLDPGRRCERPDRAAL